MKSAVLSLIDFLCGHPPALARVPDWEELSPQARDALVVWVKSMDGPAEDAGKAWSEALRFLPDGTEPLDYIIAATKAASHARPE